MTSPLEFCQGPLPMRSRALTVLSGAARLVLVERYACQVLPPAPTVAASFWQWASAPSRPPRSAPLPGPALVTKKVMLGACGGCCCACAIPPKASSVTEASMAKRNELCILVLPVIVDFDLSGEVPKQKLSTAGMMLARGAVGIVVL